MEQFLLYIPYAGGRLARVRMTYILSIFIYVEKILFLLFPEGENPHEHLIFLGTVAGNSSVPSVSFVPRRCRKRESLRIFLFLLFLLFLCPAGQKKKTPPQVARSWKMI